MKLTALKPFSLACLAALSLAACGGEASKPAESSASGAAPDRASPIRAASVSEVPRANACTRPRPATRPPGPSKLNGAEVRFGAARCRGEWGKRMFMCDLVDVMIFAPSGARNPGSLPIRPRMPRRARGGSPWVAWLPGRNFSKGFRKGK